MKVDSARRNSARASVAAELLRESNELLDHSPDGECRLAEDYSRCAAFLQGDMMHITVRGKEGIGGALDYLYFLEEQARDTSFLTDVRIVIKCLRHELCFRSSRLTDESLRPSLVYTYRRGDIYDYRASLRPVNYEDIVFA